jgi:hypothetical protein
MCQLNGVRPSGRAFVHREDMQVTASLGGATRHVSDIRSVPVVFSHHWARHTSNAPRDHSAFPRVPPSALAVFVDVFRQRSDATEFFALDRNPSIST